MAKIYLNATGIAWQKIELLEDCNGEPIALGDIVYAKDGRRFKVIAIGTKYIFGESNNMHMPIDPKVVSHRSLDSWQKIINDAMRGCFAYCEDHGLTVDEENPESYDRAMRWHLLVRCQNLAEEEYGVD